MRTREIERQAPKRVQQVTGRFYRSVRLRTVHGRRSFSVMKPHRAANVFLTIEERRFRMRVREGGAIAEQEVVVPQGAILLQRSRERDWPIYAIYPSLYAARRGLLYGIAGYDEAEIGGSEGERPVMRAAQAEFDDACALLASWSRLDAIERIALTDRLEGFIAAHERARDPDKAAAVEEIDRITRISDALGRENPAAAALVVAKAHRLLGSRSARIGRIHPRESLRLAVVQGEITLAMEVAEDLHRRVSRTFLPASTRPVPEMRRHAETLAGRLLSLSRQLALWWGQPFGADREALAPHFLEAATAFRDLRPTDAHEALLVAEAQLERILARHDLLVAVEHIAILPADPEKAAARVDEAKRLLRNFHGRYRHLFPSVGKEEALPDWRKRFREGTHALKAGDLLPAKEHLAAAAALLAA